MRGLALLFVGFLFWACGPEPIPDPVAAQLVAPRNLDNCTTADKISDIESQVTFQWNSALHTDDYELVIRNQKTGILTRKTTALTSLNQVLSRGSNYSWWINSRATLSAITAKSEVWHFYLEGEPELKHVPFPAALLFPESEAVVSLVNNNLTFKWEGSDLDLDIAYYSLYIGTASDNLTLVEGALTQTQSVQTLKANTIYFWQVVTTDREGNTSASAIGTFTTE